MTQADLLARMAMIGDLIYGITSGYMGRALHDYSAELEPISTYFSFTVELLRYPNQGLLANL
jgi:hypothetical protein